MEGVQKIPNLLSVVQRENGRDSATIVGWSFFNTYGSRWPSRKCEYWWKSSCGVTYSVADCTEENEGVSN